MVINCYCSVYDIYFIFYFYFYFFKKKKILAYKNKNRLIKKIYIFKENSFDNVERRKDHLKKEEEWKMMKEGKGKE